MKRNEVKLNKEEETKTGKKQKKMQEDSKVKAEEISILKLPNKVFGAIFIIWVIIAGTGVIWLMAKDIIY